MLAATTCRFAACSLVVLTVIAGCQTALPAYRSGEAAPPQDRMAVRLTVQGIMQVRWITARRVEDVLNSVPGLVAARRGSDDLSLRLSGREAAVMIDGVHALAADLLLLYPWELAEVEVLRGAVSTAVYGSRGESGIIRVTTKRTR